MAEPTLRCAAHPDMETKLRCGKCGKPICPRCMVQTPVGARCRECAQVRRIPTFAVSPLYYLRAIGAGLGMAIVAGLLWGLIRNVVPFGYLFNILLALGSGWVVAEVVSLAVNRKRGRGLAAVGAMGMVVSYLVGYYSLRWWGVPYAFSLWDILALVLGVVLVVTRLR